MGESDVPSSQSEPRDTPSSPVPPRLGLQRQELSRFLGGGGMQLECKYSRKWQWQQSLGLLWDKAKSRYPGTLSVPICRAGIVLSC